MCGLSGYSTHQNAKLTEEQKSVRNKIFTGLLLSMQERGVDSAGLSGICKNTPHTLKQAVSANRLVQLPEYHEFMKHDHRVLIGHTRAASSGAINNENAHPFTFGSITGAHNGHVYNHREIYPEGDVDSQSIFYNLDKYENDYEKAFREIRGRFALTWFDARYRNKMYMVSGGNPLVLTLVHEINTLFWCSLNVPLQAVIGSHFSMKNKTFWSPKENYVYEITAMHQIRKKKIEWGKFQTSYSSQNDRGFNTGYKHDDIPNASSCLTGGGKTRDEREAKILNELQQFTTKPNSSKASYVQHPEGWEDSNWDKIYNMDVDDMEAVLSSIDSGCVHCEKWIDIELEGGVFWDESQKRLLCVSCADDEDLMDVLLYINMIDFQQLEYELVDRKDMIAREEIIDFPDSYEHE